MLLKNVSGQGIYLFEYVAATGLAKTGDAANITGYYSLDNGTATAFATATPTEESAAHMPGVYWQPLAQAETNGNAFGYAWTSTTSGCVVVPIIGFTTGVSIPVAAPGAANGLHINGANTGPLSVSGGVTYANNAGDAFALTSSGGNGNGINAAGNGTGAGLLATGGATGNGIKGIGGSTSGAGINGTAPTSGDGFHAVGGGAFHGCNLAAGATGNGLNLIGGATSGVGLNVTTTLGDGISVTPTAGNAMTLTANGTSKHGLSITGGTAGTSDGLHCVAGTGGVDIRGNQVGNITGNLSGSAGSVTAIVSANTTQFLGHAVVLDANNYPGVNIVDVAGQPASTYTGQAQAGSSTGITLASGEANNPLYCELAIVGGTGAGQKAVCNAWNSSTKFAGTYCYQGAAGAWVTNPDSTSLYAINDIVLTLTQIATALWTDTTAGDFTTLGSPGKVLVSQLGGAFTSTSSSVYSTASLVNAPTGGSAPTASAIATAVWQDTTAGDFTVANSIGKGLFTGGVVPGGANGLFIAGTNAATTVTTAFTTTFTGNLTGNVGGSVASVAGAVGSVAAISAGAITTASFAAGAVTSAVMAASCLDSIIIETGMNLPQAISIIAAACAGQSSGVDVGSPVYKAANNPGAGTRIAATATAGNRSAVTLTLPAI